MIYYHVETYQESRGHWVGFLKEPCLGVQAGSREEVKSRALNLLQEIYGGRFEVIWVG